MIDMTRKYWGHNLSLKQDLESGLLKGFIWVTPVPKIGDEVSWETSYGYAVGRIVECEWTINVDDMFSIVVEVVKRVER